MRALNVKSCSSLLAVLAVAVLAPACGEFAPGFSPDGGANAGGGANGDSCTAPGDCQSGFCVDGVCCNAACTDLCVACNVTGIVGMCSPIRGQPVKPRAACGDGSPCGLACDGVNPAACSFPGTNILCRTSSCTNGVATIATTCDGSGHCPAGQTLACAPYRCGAVGCQFTCAADADCVDGYYCDSSHSCIAVKAQGTRCGADHECTTGMCVDGYCCDAPCGDTCAACNVAGKLGTCSAVTGPPVGTRTACGGSGDCKGACDGQHTDACRFPSATTVCAAAMCSDGLATAASLCDGAGKCVAGAATTCPNGCDGTSCASAAPPDMTADASSPPPSSGCSLGGAAPTRIDDRLWLWPLGLLGLLGLRRRRRVAPRSIW